jgi:hypothetical protein
MKTVLFVQLPPPRFSFREPPTNIPLAAGFLASALDLAVAREVSVEILEPGIADVFGDAALIGEVAARRPSVLALTLYVWNVERSLYLAANLKRRLPGIKVLIGGPEVTADNRWVLEHPAVDAGIIGEGESRIAAMVEALLGDREPLAVPGAFFRDGSGLRINTEPAPPWDLASCPYPYLTGGISPSLDGTIFLESVRGCPFRCGYCYYHKAFKDLRPHPADVMEEVLDFAYVPGSKVRSIYLMDPTFNARKGFRRLLRSMCARRSMPFPTLHTELRADLLTPDDVELLARAGLTSAEVGLQTINPEALAKAGRSGDPEKTAAGVALLKNSAIEVTTGIILGLPGDAPEWFSKTLSWLKEREAYSVVHPFLLSVLPGTDFRQRSQSLGLSYDPKPPYYVRETPTFPRDAFAQALDECEHVLDMEIDYFPPPSLVDRGPDLIRGPEDVSCASKWILDPLNPSVVRLTPRVMERAANCFTLWFRGRSGVRCEKAMLAVLGEFVRYNPHAVLRVVVEFGTPPRLEFFDRALDAAADPGLFVNRSYQPMYGEGEVVTPDFTMVMPDPGDPGLRDEIGEDYGHMASIVWDISSWNDRLLEQSETPLLISAPIALRSQTAVELFRALRSVHEKGAEEVLFRDPDLRTAWEWMTSATPPQARLSERILYTGFPS